MGILWSTILPTAQPSPGSVENSTPSIQRETIQCPPIQGKWVPTEDEVVEKTRELVSALILLVHPRVASHYKSAGRAQNAIRRITTDAGFWDHLEVSVPYYNVNEFQAVICKKATNRLMNRPQGSPAATDIEARPQKPSCASTCCSVIAVRKAGSHSGSQTPHHVCCTPLAEDHGSASNEHGQTHITGLPFSEISVTGFLTLFSTLMVCFVMLVIVCGSEGNVEAVWRNKH